MHERERDPAVRHGMSLSQSVSAGKTNYVAVVSHTLCEQTDF